MAWSHEVLVICGHVYEQLVEVDVLLMMGANQVVEGMARTIFAAIPLLSTWERDGTKVRERACRFSGVDCCGDMPLAGVGMRCTLLTLSLLPGVLPRRQREY
jgi:hypothetical protein